MIQHLGGKVQIFSATRPTLGEAKLKNREGSGPQGPATQRAAQANGKNEKGPSLLTPDCEFYKTLAVDCSKQQVCLDLWSCAQAYTDIATLGQLAKHTAGSVYHYPNFSDVAHGEQLSRDLQHSLTREQGWEAVMRVRVSRGLKTQAFHGHFFIRGTDLLALPNIDEDKTFAIEIGHEENALSNPTCCMQAALLYTTSSGERRIRVHTIELPVTSGLSSLYEAADVDACANLMGLIAVEHALAQRSIMDGAEKLQTQCLELLRSFRSLCPPTAKTSGALLLPDGLKLLPLYTLGLMKGGLFAANDATRADDRSALMHHFSCAPTPRSTAMLHPRLVQVYPPQQAMPATALPRLLPLTAGSLTADGAFLMEDGRTITLWLGHAAPTELLTAIFGWPSLEGVDAAQLRLLPAEQVGTRSGRAPAHPHAQPNPHPPNPQAPSCPPRLRRHSPRTYTHWSSCCGWSARAAGCRCKW